MRAKYIIIALIGIVLTFLWTGNHVSSRVENNMISSYKEFEIATRVLSPLLETYRAIVVDGQVKVAHNQMTLDEYCQSMSKVSERQKILIGKYSESITGRESIDDRELFYLINSISLYIEKMRGFCRKQDKESIHTSLYSGELYRLIDPTIYRISRMIDTKLQTAERLKLEASREIEIHHRILWFAASLSMVLGAAVFFSRNVIINTETPFVKNKE